MCTGGTLYSNVEVQLKRKQKDTQKNAPSSYIFYRPQKTKFEDLQPEIRVGVEGCMGNPKLIL
jgi:hypothetical protein